MMERKDDKDREIERLFDAAREHDRESAPAFRQIVAQGRLDKHRHERPRIHRSRLVWLGATGTVVVAAFAALLGPHMLDSMDLGKTRLSVEALEIAPRNDSTTGEQPAPDPRIVVRKDVPPPPTPAAQTADTAQGSSPTDTATGKEKIEPKTVAMLRSLGYTAKAPTEATPQGVPGAPAAPPPREIAEAFNETRPIPGRFYQNERTLAHGARDSDFKAEMGGVEGGSTAPPPRAPKTAPSARPPSGPVLSGAGPVQDPVLLDKVAPEYPELARRERLAGNVTLQTFINERGTVDDVKVLGSSNPVFNQEAMEAVRQWQYRPAMQDGKPVSVYYTVTLDFDPDQMNTETYDRIEENPFLEAVENPLSTFSIDVDTASYANVRRFLNAGQRPPRDAVRIEEMVNYFRYDYPGPKGRDPFGASIEIADCPWDPDHRLARIGLKGREIDRGRREPSNLVFLVDVSGSMNQPNKLPLLVQSLGMLANELDDRDRVAIVVYAGSSGLVLPSTPGSSRGEIQAALSRLSAGGSTNGGEGLRLAYSVARENFVRGGTNRVILATDGDFNVGVTTRAELLSLIESDAKQGIFLTALGFGMGNYKDSTLETLADKGNGNYAYIDDLREARKVLVEELSGTLVTIAKDVKIQVEFNPAEVSAYRLIGYENRMLRKEDFNDDRKDAGEIGAGHTVTALYEIVPVSSRRGVDVPAVDPLRYQKGPALTDAARRGELFTLKLRYKEPDGDRSRLLEFPAKDTGARRGSPDFEFAASVAGFGMLLRDSAFVSDFTYADVRDLARGGIGRGSDREYREELVRLVDRAAQLD